MDIRQQLFDRITVLREKAGYSAMSLRWSSDHQEDYLYKVKVGKVSLSVVDLEKIAKLCGSSLEELFYEKFEKYNVEKKIIDRVRELDKKGSDAVMSLLAVIFEGKRLLEERKNEGN